MAPYTLLAIDDHPAVLSGLRLLLAADARFGLWAEASSPTAACAQAQALQPHLIVTDLVLGGADGVALIKELRALAPSALILVYSGQDERLWARHALRAGACAYVSKAESLDVVAAALDTVLRGGIHMSAAVQALHDKPDADDPAGPHALGALSARELQILRLIGSSASLQAMSQALGLSVKTVGTYRERLKTKLGFDNARALELFAARHAQRP